MGDGDPNFNPYKAPDAPASGEVLPESPPVTSVRFRLTADDVKRFTAAVRPRWFKMMGWFLIVLFILLLTTLTYTLVFALLRTPRSRLWSTISPTLAPLLVIVVVFAAKLVEILRRRRGGPDASSEIRVELTPEGLMIGHEGVGDSKRTWASVAEVRDDQNLIMFIHKELFSGQRRRSEIAAFVIPRRAFPTPEAAASFLREARRWHSLATAPSP